LSFSGVAVGAASHGNIAQRPNFAASASPRDSLILPTNHGHEPCTNHARTMDTRLRGDDTRPLRSLLVGLEAVFSIDESMTHCFPDLPGGAGVRWEGVCRHPRKSPEWCCFNGLSSLLIHRRPRRSMQIGGPIGGPDPGPSPGTAFMAIHKLSPRSVATAAPGKHEDGGG
jgi:hypothetical protein